MSTPSKPAYLDTALSFDERVKDLVGRLTLAEKVTLIGHAAQGIPRLNIPGYNYWSEALHGVARNGRATVFPQAIGLAATWDKALVHKVATAISDEARVKYHAALERNNGAYTDLYQGLTFWSPNINIFRDPRWGRGQETWGEDPFLTGEMASEYVRGMQGDDPKYLKTAACAKHYAVHSGPEKDRHIFNAVVTKRELFDTYLPAFKKLVVEAKVEAVMGAYNRVYGEPACGSELLLDKILRTDWGFDGHVVSDCGALMDFHKHHNVTEDAAESAALALQHGCDLGCEQGCTVFTEIPEAIERGLISEADLDRSVSRVLKTRFKLGMFDPAEDVPYTDIPADVVASDAHRELAYQAATESVVLLKNKGGILPIKPTTRKLLVTGPTAASMEVLLGNYYGFNERMTTFLEGLTGRIPEGMGFEYTAGVPLSHPREISETWAPMMAKQSELTLVFAGNSSFLEGEEGESILSPLNGDRADLSLPKPQVDYIKELASHDIKIVLIVTGGSPIALGEVEDLVEAILFVWYPGMEGGRAVADILFGDLSPAGKLPVTFPKSVEQLPPFDDYSMDGRTYRYMSAEPLYPFGFGLGYSNFEYADLKLSRDELAAGDSLQVSFTLTNVGERTAPEVAQCYLSDIEASSVVPLTRLVGFERVTLKAGESRTIYFTITPDMMSFINDDGTATLEPGEFQIEVGGASPGKRAQELAAPTPLNGTFTLFSKQ